MSESIDKCEHTRFNPGYQQRCEGCGHTKDFILGYQAARSVKVRPAERELLCQRCDREYPIWFAPNDIWNATVKDGEHFLCPTCFAVLVEQGGEHTIWELRPEEKSR